MGWLELQDGQRFALGAHTLVGRDQDCHLRIDDRRVSAEQAAITWSTRGWELRDLGSRNGTHHNGVRLRPGQRVSLVVNDQLRFATDTTFRVGDIGAPVARALAIDGAPDEIEIDGVLGFFAATRVTARLSVVDDGWVLEHAEGRTERCVDQQVVVVAGRRYCLELPPSGRAAAGTTIDAAPISLREASLRWRVSRDGEHASLEVTGADGTHLEVPPRAFQQVLVALAQARLSDREHGVPEPECGWIYADQLPAMLDLDRTRINLELHRARKVIEQVGIADADAIVERRVDAHQLRLGVVRLAVDQT